MNETLYRFFVGLVDAFIWGGELLGGENLPEEGPAVFVANHLGPKGPIGAVCALPLRLHFWAIGEMVDKEMAPNYLRLDFVEPFLKLKPPLSMSFSTALSRVTVPLLRSLGCLPIYRGDYEKMHGTLKESLALLMEGKYFLIFPENAAMGEDTLFMMHPFQKTVFRLGEMYYEQTRKRLAFYPVAIHEGRKVRLGQPVFYNPLNLPAKERLRLKYLVEANIRKMRMEMEERGDFTGLLTPEQRA